MERANRQALAEAEQALAEAKQALDECLLVDLELAHTFVDIAATTSDPTHAVQSIKNAIAALRTVNKFYADVRDDSRSGKLEVRREELARRLRAVTGIDQMAEAVRSEDGSPDASRSCGPG